jgi:hypothetical protein
MLVDGVLYTFQGVMQRHANEDWYFLQNSIVCPKLTGKKKDKAILDLSEQAREYMREHPEVMHALKIQSWERDLANADHGMSQAEYDMVRAQESLEHAQKRIADETVERTTYLKKLIKTLEERPEGAVLPPPDKARSRVLQKMLTDAHAVNPE